ncbi:MAG: arsenate reductase ArsC [Thermoplasmata archaeon]|nr:arsenate reductase ArsC [Thermoplasmata archaeon]
MMKKVLFICIGNTCRSQMAKGFFNTLSSSKSADSAGMKPETHVEPSAIKVMNEVGIDISHYKPKKLTFEMNDLFDVIVTMGCVDDCPLTPREKTIAWTIEDPKGKSLDKYREVRDTIRNHVEKLILDIIEKK